MTGDFQISSIRTARKRHACGECREPIQPGEKYNLWSGKGDGGMYSAKMCLGCNDANYQAWQYIHASRIRDEYGPCFGELLSWLEQDALDNDRELPPYPDPQPDTKTLDMFPGLPPVKRERTKREQIAAYSAMLKQYLDQNFRLVDGWCWVKK